MLAFMVQQMSQLEIPYEFWEWTDDVPTEYWIGEFLEEPTDTEDGKRSYTFVLTGTTRGSFLGLEQTRQKIEKHFRHGITDADANRGIAVHYSNATPLPTDAEGIRRLEINLSVTEWKVN